MRAFGHPAAAMPPDYRHPPSVVVPLAFSFALDGAKISRVALAPPSLDGLELLRGEGGLSARTILLVTTPLSLRAIGMLRWPDVEALLAVAIDLLPPDLAAMMRLVAGEGEPAPYEASGAEDEKMATPAPSESYDAGIELGLDPADFIRTV